MKNTDNLSYEVMKVMTVMTTLRNNKIIGIERNNTLKNIVRYLHNNHNFHNLITKHFTGFGGEK